MSTESKDLISLVEKLRQEQEFVSFYKNQVRLGVQELNTCCDTVFHSLWLSHTLSYGLHRVLAHHLHTYEWSIAFGNASSINFVNASQAIQSSFLVEQYGQFLSALLNNPKLLVEVLRWAEMEGLDCNCLVSDLMSVVYGHCVFQHDHTLFLLLLKELLRHLVKGCDSPKDLFSGVESVFNRALSEYCSQLIELRTFLTEALQEPLMQVLTCEDYLEYDVNKAGSRFQASTEGQTGPLLDTTTFLFSEDLESSCEQLAKLAMIFLESLVKMLGQFPLSLRWLLGNLKSLVQQKWLGISPTELRRPISDILFGDILSSAIVNPDSYGIVNPTMVIGPIARYNLSQVTAVLQGCAWILDKPSSSKYPIHKVVKRMNVKLFCSLMDSVDGGYREELPDLPSSLPGLKRSAYLTSQAQLNNLVGLVCAMATSLSDKEDSDPVYSAPSSLLTHVPPPMRELASRSPYSIQTKTLSFPAPSRQEPGDIKTTPKKKSADSHRTTSRPVFRKKRSNSTAHTLVMDAKSPSTIIPRSSTFGHAATLELKSLKQGSEKQLGHSISQTDSLAPLNFHLPQEVLVIPILDQVDAGKVADTGSRLTATLWDFDLLSEEEFMGQSSRTPTYQRVERVDPQPDEHNLSSSTTKLSPTPDNSLAATDEASAGSRHPLHTPPPPKWEQSSQQEPPSPDIDVNHNPSSSTHSPRLLSYKKSHSPIFIKSSAQVQTPTSSPSERRLLQKLPNPHTFSTNQILQPVTSPVIAVGEISGPDSSEEKPKMGFRFPESPVPEVVNKSSSLENLLDMDGEEVQEEEEEHPAENIRFKRLRKLRDRLKRRKTRDQKEKKRRSQSELVTKESMEDVEAVLDFPKRRSRSELSPPTREEDKELEESPRAVYKYRRSYTLLTGHITAKYARKKKSASVTDVDSKSSTESPKKDTIQAVDQKYESVAEVTVMSVAKFKRTLYIDQLKYKLRVALHGIHTPLSSNPVYLQLCADEDSMCDSRYQLMTLLQNALRRSRWQHNDMELALLTELLRMVEPLPNALVQAAVEGVYEDYTKRSGYIAYLVKSHQKFQDAKLQVGAVQTAVNRMRQVQEELFVNFAVRIYLEGQEGELGKITHQMEALCLADEKCSLMEECLDIFAEAIQEDPPWNFWEDMDQVVNCLEDHLFAHVYDHVFHPNGDSDVMRDQIFSHHLSQLSERTSLTHRSLQIPSVYHSGCPWVSAQKHLKSMAIYKSPRGKLRCVVQSCKILISLLQYAKCGDPPGADDLFPVLVYTLIKVNPPSLLSTVQYVRNFAEGQLVGEDAYWWAQFSTAVEFTKTLE